MKITRTDIIKNLANIKNDDIEKADGIVKLCLAVAQGKITLIAEQDCTCSFSDVCGDMFDPEINSDTPAATLKKQKEAYRRKVKSQGVYTIIAKYWNGREWSEASLQDNVIGGFVGKDVCGSGYDYDLLTEALNTYNKQRLDADGYVIDPFRGRTLVA